MNILKALSELKELILIEIHKCETESIRLAVSEFQEIRKCKSKSFYVSKQIKN